MNLKSLIILACIGVFNNSFCQDSTKTLQKSIAISTGVSAIPGSNYFTSSIENIWQCEVSIRDCEVEIIILE